MIYIFGIYIVFSYCLFRWLNSERKKTIKRNDEIAQENEILEQKFQAINENIHSATQSLETIHKNIANATNAYNNLKSVFEEFNNSLNEKKNKAIEKANSEIAGHQEDIQNNITSIINSFNKEQEIIKLRLADAKARIAAYLADLKRQQEIEQNKAFYSLDLSSSELEDTAKLLEMAKTLNYGDVLRKLVYKTFFEKKMNDLLGRVAGAKAECAGVYKITHIDSGMIYIGQTTNIKDRWRKHLKCGLGIETPSTNSFYQGMIKYGVWNFTWEIIEFCSKDKLNEVEKYWIDFYQTNIWGWNSKGGNSK